MRLVLMTLIVISSGVLCFAQERTWTSDDGKKIVGEMLREDGEAVVLKVGVKEFKVPLTKLSTEDREWIAAQRKEREERNKEAAALAGTNKSFPKSDTQPVTFHVYYPSNYAADNPRPMIILFNASGDGKAILDTFKQSCETIGWIGVGCDTFRNGAPNSEQEPLFKELLPIIESSVMHNPQLLYTGGMSGGAARALHYTALFDRPWKGVISCGGWLGKEFDLEYRKGMAVAWVNGDKDNNANAWVPQDSEVLKKRKCKTKLFPFPGGHVIGPPDILTEAMRWAQEIAEKNAKEK